MDVILVSWGFRDRAELEALGKAVIVRIHGGGIICLSFGISPKIGLI